MKIEDDFEAQIQEIEQMIDKFKEMSRKHNDDFSGQIKELEDKLEKQKEELYQRLTPWQTVQLARHPRRPVFQNYVNLICDEFIELHGDRRFSDDRALIGGFATIDKFKVMLIGHNRGENVEENIERNFGMALPDGYRKALRLMKLAEKYRRPVVTFIDTSGAYPGQNAEERGQAEAIATNLTEMARLKVPIISVVTGEGGSGGALGIGVGDVLLMLKHAIYSVISPEGCASILWRDGAFAPDAAASLKLTAESLLELGVIDEVIPEPVGGAHNKPVEVAASVKEALLTHLGNLKGVSVGKLQNRRFEKYARLGVFTK